MDCFRLRSPSYGGQVVDSLLGRVVLPGGFANSGVSHPRHAVRYGSRDGERQASKALLHLAQSSLGACTMDIPLFIGLIASIYIAGRIAERRGRSFRSWAWVGTILGPLAIPLLFLLPNLHPKNGNRA
jgi:hypothetical protein